MMQTIVNRIYRLLFQEKDEKENERITQQHKVLVVSITFVVSVVVIIMIIKNIVRNMHAIDS